jgi:hypothetical protein
MHIENVYGNITDKLSRKRPLVLRNVEAARCSVCLSLHLKESRLNCNLLV